MRTHRRERRRRRGAAKVKSTKAYCIRAHGSLAHQHARPRGSSVRPGRLLCDSVYPAKFHSQPCRSVANAKTHADNAAATATRRSITEDARGRRTQEHILETEHIAPYWDEADRRWIVVIVDPAGQRRVQCTLAWSTSRRSSAATGAVGSYAS
jgi:hypothetical protein